MLDTTIPVTEVFDTFNLSSLINEVNYVDATAEKDLLELEAYNLFRDAVRSLKTIRASYITVSGVSMGKDSTLMLLASLCAHEELVAERKIPPNSPFIVSTVNTLVENHMMTILVKSEIEKLKAYCKRKDINLDMRVSSPNLSNQWSSMFLSGLKLLSTSRLNNDCSEQLKINSAVRTERSLVKKYGENIVTLLGSRSSESAKRSNSLSKRNQINKTAEELIERANGSRQERIFAPIVSMTSEHVWTLLLRAGSKPIINPGPNFEPIPSYQKNHLALKIIYGDGSDSSCPVSSFSIKGSTQKVGGCGSTRYGCALCLKPLIEKSGEAQAKFERHSSISANILSVRNYMMNISQNSSYRTWHTRAIDKTTGAIAAQPNVLNAATLDKLMTWVCQITIDEIARAKVFKQRVAVGDEMLCPAYADIFNDPSMTDEEKNELAMLYRKYAVEPLHEPMSRDISLYLSSIHSRDGIKLPPFRAYYLYKTLVTDFLADVENATYPEWDYGKAAYNNVYRTFEEAHKLIVKEYEEKGLRLPYPTVTADSGNVDDIPDACMIMPGTHIDGFNYVPHTGHVEIERAEGCLIDSRFSVEKVPYRIAKRFLPESELVKLQEKKGSDLVAVQGFGTDSLSMFKAKPSGKTLRKQKSSRKIKKASRKGGKYRVIERGRTSLDKPSFGQCTADFGLKDSVSKQLLVLEPNLHKIYQPFMAVDEEAANAYTINTLGYYQWLDYEGEERALKEHDDAIERAKLRGEHIYYYHGEGVFTSLMRWNVLDLSDGAKVSSMAILKRSAYFSALGLFSLDDQAFAKFAANSTGKESFLFSDFINTRTKAMLSVDTVLSMNSFRDYKSTILCGIRKKRNAAKRVFKAEYQQYLNAPALYSIEQAKLFLESKLDVVKDYTYRLANTTFLNEHNLYDTDETPRIARTVLPAYIRYMLSFTQLTEYFADLLPKHLVKGIFLDITLRAKITEVTKLLHAQYSNAIIEAIEQYENDMEIKAITHPGFYGAINGLDKQVLTDLKAEFTVIKEDVISYSLSDSPAMASGDVQW